MSIDYGEKERQFLDTLEADTGRDLDAWMAAIASQGLTHRNDIIDWLRRQGFMFSKASWIERIHNNGGRPIYTGAAPRAPARARRLPETRPEPLPAPRREPLPAPDEPAAPVTRASPPDPPATRDALLARAKAYRPLAVYMMGEIVKAVPEAATEARDGYFTFRLREREFALLAIGPKELRLGLALGEHRGAAVLEAARFTPALAGAPPMTHMAVLTDARQITPALIAAVADAAAKAPANPAHKP